MTLYAFPGGGGSILSAARTPAEAAARAAEQRARDNKWCPSEQLMRGEAGMDDAILAVIQNSAEPRRSAQGAKPGPSGAHQQHHGAQAGPSAKAMPQPKKQKPADQQRSNALHHSVKRKKGSSFAAAASAGKDVIDLTADDADV